MKNIYMVNAPTYPTPVTHYYTTTKFMNGFKYNGHLTAEINDINLFNLIQDSEDNVFIMSDHFYSIENNWFDFFNNLGNRFQKSTWIFWHFHNIYKLNYLDKSIDFPFKKYIFTGEHYRNITDDLRNHWGGLIDWYTGLENYVKLPFSADINPFEIDSLMEKRNNTYDCGYVGARYKEQWTNQLSQKYNCFVHYYWPTLDEESRINNGFLSSKISLGFNSDSNAKLGLPTERIFEGLAYGCVVLSDCKVAEEATDGVVVYVEDYNDLESAVELYSKNEKERLAKQVLGIKYAKEKGTYYHVAQEFLSKIESLF